MIFYPLLTYYLASFIGSYAASAAGQRIAAYFMGVINSPALYQLFSWVTNQAWLLLPTPLQDGFTSFKALLLEGGVAGAVKLVSYLLQIAAPLSVWKGCFYVGIIAIPLFVGMRIVFTIWHEIPEIGGSGS